MDSLPEFTELSKYIFNYFEQLRFKKVDIGAKLIYACLFIELCSDIQANSQKDGYRTAKEVHELLNKKYDEKFARPTINNYISILNDDDINIVESKKSRPASKHRAIAPSIFIHNHGKLRTWAEDNLLDFEIKHYDKNNRFLFINIADSINNEEELFSKISEFTRVTLWSERAMNTAQKVSMVIGGNCGNTILVKLFIELKATFSYPNSNCQVLFEKEILSEPTLKDSLNWIKKNTALTDKFRDISSISGNFPEIKDLSDHVIIIRKEASNSRALVIGVSPESRFTGSVIKDKSLITSMQIAFNHIWSKAHSI